MQELRAAIAFASASITLLLTIYTFIVRSNRGPNKTLTAFGVLMAGSTGWSVASGLGYIAPTVAEMRFWLHVEQLAIGVVPGAWFALALAYTGHEKWLTRQSVSLLSIEPILTLAMTATDPWHGLMWAETALATTTDGTAYLTYSFGSYHYVHLVYSYALVLGSVVLFVRMVADADHLYRRQSAALSMGAIAPLATNVIGGGNEFWGVVFTMPAGFTIAGVALGYAIFRFRLLDVVPVGRSTVIENMRDGFVVTDENDRIVDLNPAGRVLADDPAIGRNATVALPDVAHLFEATDPTDYAEDELVVDTDDGKRYYTVRLAPLQDDGRLGRLLTIRDVTDNRRVEKRYQALIENASDVITIIDADGKLEYISPSIEPIFGYDQTTLRGESILQLVAPEDRTRVTNAFETIGTESNTVRFEYRIEDATGNCRVVESVGQDLADNPFVQGIVVHSRDVTERHRREQELERANEHLETFVNTVSHDLRNPLNVAAGNLDLARSQGDEKYFDRVERAHERMENLIRDLLTLAEQDQSVEETARLNLSTVAKDAWETVETGPATLEVMGTTTIEADEGRLKQLFENLYRNAIEHAGETVTLRVDTAENGFYVEDDGPGIPDEKREEVFRNGYTTSSEGTGLGLSIVENITDAHGWTVRACESESGGARFEIGTAAGHSFTHERAP